MRGRRTTVRSARRASIGLAAAGATVLAGCDQSAPSGPSDDPGLSRVAIVPDLAYRIWWDEIAACSGLDGDIGRVRFFEVVSPVFVEGRQFPCGSGFLCNGMWEAPHDISLAPALTRDARLVKHEMLHDLLGSAEHPPVFEACEVDWTGGDPRRDGPRGSEG